VECPACGHRNLPGHRFCFRCGESLSWEGQGASTPSIDPPLRASPGTGSGYGGVTSQEEAWRRGASGRFDVDNQRAATISNVGRDQVVYKVRQSPKLGGPHRAGPWMMGFGGVIFLAGLGVWGFAILSQILEMANILRSASSSQATPPAFPAFDFHTDQLAIGAAISFVGVVVFFIGLFVTIVTWRTRRVRR
jgi:hypothetical protein